MRLIDADALKEELENSKYIFGANKTIEFIQNSEIDRAISFIETAPTVEERPHGEWKDYTDDGYVECPFCGSATNCDGNINDLHYCFFCGAKMVKEGVLDGDV